jgi:hypothetical protein
MKSKIAMWFSFTVVGWLEGDVPERLMPRQFALSLRGLRFEASAGVYADRRRVDKNAQQRLRREYPVAQLQAKKQVSYATIRRNVPVALEWAQSALV